MIIADTATLKRITDARVMGRGAAEINNRIRNISAGGVPCWIEQRGNVFLWIGARRGDCISGFAASHFLGRVGVTVSEAMGNTEPDRAAPVPRDLGYEPERDASSEPRLSVHDVSRMSSGVWDYE